MFFRPYPKAFLVLGTVATAFVASLLTVVVADAANETTWSNASYWLPTAPITPQELTAFDDIRVSLSNNAGNATGETTGTTWDVTTVPSSAVIKVRALNEEAGEKNETLYRLANLVSFLPSSVGGFISESIVNTEAAGLLAMYHFNYKVDGVVPELTSDPELRDCNVRWTMDLYDTRYSPIEASRILIDDILYPSPQENRSLLSHPDPAAIVGAVRSAVTEPLALLSGLRGIPTVSYQSSSSQLDDYPYFGRTIPTDRGRAAVAVSFLRLELNVTHVSVLFVKDTFGEDYFRDFMKEAMSLVPPMVVVSQSYDYHPVSEHLSLDLGPLIEARFNYVFAILSSPSVKHVMVRAKNEGLAGPGKQWLFSDNFSVPKAMDAETERDLFDAVKGSSAIALTLRTRNREFDSAWTSMRANVAFKDYYQSRKQGTGQNVSGFDFFQYPTLFEYLHYDAVMALAIASCKADDEFFTGPQLFDAFKRNNFTGASGYVRFDETTGNRDLTTVDYAVINLVAADNREDRNNDVEDKLVLHSVITHVQLSNPLLPLQPPVWVKQGPMVFADGTDDPPNALPPLQIISNHFIPRSILFVGLTMTIMCMAMPLLWGAWTIRHRQTNVVRKSQPVFLIMICGGTFLMGLSLVPTSFQEPMPPAALDFACMAFPWLFCTGFVVAFSALFSKTRRINKLFARSSAFIRVKVSPRNVLRPFIILLSLNSAILIAWTVASPLYWQRRWFPAVDYFGRSVESYSVCAPQPGKERFVWLFFALIAVIDSGCLAYAIYQNHLARHVPTDYNESHFIGMSMKLILQSFVVGLPVVGVLCFAQHPSSTYLVRVMLVCLICAVTLTPIFFPKVIAQREAERNKVLRAQLKAERQTHIALARKNVELKNDLEVFRDVLATMPVMGILQKPEALQSATNAAVLVARGEPLADDGCIHSSSTSDTHISLAHVPHPISGKKDESN